MKQLLFYLSIVGWMLSLFFHFVALLANEIILSPIFIFIFHSGIVVVLFLIILRFRNLGLLDSNVKPKQIFKITFANKPTWLKAVVIIQVFYAIVSVIVFVISVPNFNMNHLDHHLQVIGFRAFSSAWIAFYGFAAALLFPFRKDKKLPLT